MQTTVISLFQWSFYDSTLVILHFWRFYLSDSVLVLRKGTLHYMIELVAKTTCVKLSFSYFLSPSRTQRCLTTVDLPSGAAAVWRPCHRNWPSWCRASWTTRSEIIWAEAVEVEEWDTLNPCTIQPGKVRHQWTKLVHYML